MSLLEVSHVYTTLRARLEPYDPRLVALCTATGGLILVLLIRKLFKKQTKPPPPGPSGWPLIGSPSYSSINFKKLEQLKKQYGDIMSWRAFGTQYVMLNSYSAIREAMCQTRNGGEPFSGRVGNFFRRIFAGNKGVAGADGERWRIHRRFVLHVLRDLGFGRTLVEDSICEQADWLNTLLAEQQRAAGAGGFDPELDLVRAVNNVISRLVFAANCSGDPEFERMMNSINEVSRSFTRQTNFALMTLSLLLRPRVLYNAISMVLKLNGYMYKKIAEHRRALEQQVAKAGGAAPQQTDCVLDAYLVEARALDLRDGRGKHTFDDMQIMRVILELFSAGTVTTVHTLGYGLLYMARHPDVQQRVQREIEGAIGDRMPRTTDRQRMRFTEATLYEVQRAASLIGTMPRRAIEECEVRGYHIEKDAVAFMNIYGVHHDPTIWPAPERFDPAANFLSADKRSDAEKLEQWEEPRQIIRTEYLMPFGVGKRECLGESLVRQELFIFFVRLLQKFTIAPPEGDASQLPVDYTVDNSPIFRMPPFYKLQFIPRN